MPLKVLCICLTEEPTELKPSIYSEKIEGTVVTTPRYDFFASLDHELESMD